MEETSKMINALDDLSTLTAIPEKTLEKLMQTLAYIICQNILEEELDETSCNNVSSFDIGFGTLYIKKIPGDLKYKFTPSEEFESKLNDVLTKKLNLMENILTEKLSSKLLEVYKDLC